MNNDTDLHLLAGAYALDAVDDIERQRFEEHLRECSTCQTEINEMRETLGRLGEIESVTPPPSLKTDVLARIAETPQALPETHMTAYAQAPRRAGRATKFLAVAAAVLAIAGIGAGIYGYQQHEQSEQIIASADMLAQVMTQPDVQVKTMEMGSASSAIVMSPSAGQAMMVARNVPALPANQVYELWTLDREGKPRPAGVWTPGPNGDAAVPIDGDLATTTAIAVTVEPTGGSAQPTSKPVASVSMS